MRQAAALAILKTGANVFLTGEPGSGKTHTVNEYIKYLRRVKVKVAITASTGIAATHIGGMTIHSWSGIGVKQKITKYDLDAIASRQYVVKRIRSAAVLIVDEVSMLDGGVLDSVDMVCREVRQRREPFGGLQVVLGGDFFQLPPVARGGDQAQFAFNSQAFAEAKMLVCYLTEQHRQEDEKFLAVLAAMRRGEIRDEHLSCLNGRCKETSGEGESRAVTKLYSHNADVDRMNQQELEKISGPEKLYEMNSSGPQFMVENLKRGCLSPARLVLKEKAVVMFTKNSTRGDFVNGTLGKVAGFAGGWPVIKTVRGKKITAEPMEWTLTENDRVKARVEQVPLRLAWAMTVHKSQGMSLDASFMDLRSAFVPGQGYVALSRVRTLAGLFLAGYNETALKVDEDVQAKDNEFRAMSEAAVEAFGKMSDGQLEQMQDNFARASGGQVRVRSVDRPVAGQAYSVSSIRERFPNAYKSWSAAEDEILVRMFKAGKGVALIAELMGRQPGSIRSRLFKAGLVNRLNDVWNSGRDI